MQYSLIIPVYNRPFEIRNLLKSIAAMQTYYVIYEVLVIDDHSTQPSKTICEDYETKLPLCYFYLQEQVGAGKARNYGMQKAKGNYFIILDSDTTLPKNYLSEIDKSLKENYTDTFTAPDTAHPSFTNFQKAVDFSMTHFLTTGNIRTQNLLKKVQLRSFNMGLSKNAFQQTKGFSNKKIGEDIELSIKAQRLGLSCQCIKKAFVFHQRKKDSKTYFKQCYAFGKGRATLRKEYKEAKGFVYWMPFLFIAGFMVSLLLLFWGNYLFVLYVVYFLFIGIFSSCIYKSFKVGFMSIYTTFLQMSGYGFGYFKKRF